jgi:murein DD-endopeptidase MepM/ murein hydrolase activator NlpD
MRFRSAALAVLVLGTTACNSGDKHPASQASGNAAQPVPPVRDREALLALSTSPRHVYKENDAKNGHGKRESFLFRLVVRGASAPDSEPAGATVELRAGAKRVETIEYSAEALAAARGHADTTYSDDFDALYELRFAFKEPVALAIDGAFVTLRTARGRASLLVPIGVYQQKTKLRFPLAGDFMVVVGNGSTEGGHEERSQAFAYDVVGLGKNLELLQGDGSKNSDFVGYGRDVLAPADGLVVYARDDVADNPSTGNQDFAALLRLPDPPWAVAGNCVVIDHGDGEYSLLAHMQPGSVKRVKGDRVKQGDVVGKLGNAGATTGPHLHYHLMDGPVLLRADGLPAHFENSCVPAPKPGQFCDAK